MQSKSSKLMVAVNVLALSLATAATAHAFTGEKYAKDAKVSLEQARQIALKALPGGKITDQELEREKGGSGLRYSFDVRVGGAAEHEIGVDAKTGALLENSIEGPNSD